MHTLEAIAVAPAVFAFSLLVGHWYPSNHFVRTYVLRQTVKTTPGASSDQRSNDSSSIRELAHL